MKKKIAFIVESMVFGGVEKALIELLKVLDYDKLDVTVLLRNNKGQMQPFLDSKVKIKYWDNTTSKEYLNKLVSERKVRNVVHNVYYRMICRAFVNVWQINGWFSAKCLPPIDDGKYDWAIAFHGTTPSVAAGALYRINSTHKMLWIHAYVFCPKKYRRWFDKEYLKFDKICCVSKSMQNEFVLMFPESGKNTFICHNILNPNEIIEKANMPMERDLKHISLVTVGRLSSEKGQDIIPEAVRYLRDWGYLVNWYVVGDGYLREKIEQNIKKYGVEKWVTLVGNKINPYPYMKQCDIYVQTSSLEGWGLTVQEARILAKPIVVTPVPAMREQITNGENGLIADAMTPESIAEGVRQLLDHPERMEEFRNALKKEPIDNTAELQILWDYLES